MEIAAAVERMVLPIDPNFEKDQTNDAGTLIIHAMVIPDPFSLKTVNNFNSSPPFGLFDIFNHLIYHSTNYDKQGLAAYKSFGDYRLFNDGYVESLLTTQELSDSLFFMNLSTHSCADFTVNHLKTFQTFLSHTSNIRYQMIK